MNHSTHPGSTEGEPKYTPTPWELTTIPFELRNHDSAAAIYGPTSIHGGSCLIADISRSAGDNQATANAELIVKAVNNHEELVKALEDAVDIIQEEMPGDYRESVARFKAALNKAK